MDSNNQKYPNTPGWLSNKSLKRLIVSAFEYLIDARYTVIAEPLMLQWIQIKDEDTLFGTMITKSASAAPSTRFSMETRNAFQFLTNALLMLITETVFHASRDTTLRTEPVSSHPSTTPILPTLDVPPGIGTTKSASAAPRDGSSTQRRDACPLTTTATATTTVVPAPHASLGTL